MKIRWARAATKHRVSRARSEHVVLNAIAVIDEPAPPGSAQLDDRVVFLGQDQEGTMIEVMAVETNDGFLVIHAMPIRPKYVDYLEGATDDQA